MDIITNYLSMNVRNSLKFTKKQLLILAFFSITISAAAIVHGIYMDLEWAEIGRFTVKGLILTFFIVFPTFLFLEWSFDINNKQKFEEIEEKLAKLEGKEDGENVQE